MVSSREQHARIARAAPAVRWRFEAGYSHVVEFERGARTVAPTNARSCICRIEKPPRENENLHACGLEPGAPFIIPN